MKRLLEILEKKDFLTLVSLPRNDPDLAKAADSCAVDGIKVHANVEHKASGTRFGTWPEEKKIIERIIAAVNCPVGLMPGSGITLSREEMREAVDFGIDFIDIYDFDMPAWMLSLPLGKMIALGHGFSLPEAMTLDDLNADFIEASIVASSEYRKPLTVKEIETYRMLVQTFKKPIFVPSQKKIEPVDIPILKEIGVRGVILGTISIGDTPENFGRRLPLFINA